MDDMNDFRFWAYEFRLYEQLRVMVDMTNSKF